MNKVCFKCGLLLSLDNFYRHPKMPDGTVNKCKGCHKKDSKEYRSKNIEYLKLYDKARYSEVAEVLFKEKQKERWESRPTPRKQKFQKENYSHFDGGYKAYRNVHKWVEYHLGKPDTCEHCLSSGLRKHQIHWANVSGKYKREANDWLRLCAQCHKNYDLKK